MAISVTGPLATPSITLTAAAGGSLTAGTYEVGVACANTNSYTLLTADQRRSAADIKQVVVTANQKITVSYAAVTGATHYNIYIRNVTTGETWYGGNRRHGSSDTTATTNALSYDITSLGTRRPHFDTFTYDTTYFTPPIALNTGTVVLHISGTNSAIYYTDIYDAMNSAGLTAYIAYDKGQFWFKGQIIIDSGATGSLATYSLKTVSDIALNVAWHLLQGIIVNNSSTFTLAWGSTQRGAVLYQEAWSWNINSQYMDLSYLTILAGNWQQLRAQTYIWGGDHYLIIGANTGSTEYLTLKGCNVQNQKKDAVLSGITSNSSILASLENTTTQNCTFETFGLTTNRTGYATVRDSTVGNVGFARHVRTRNSMSDGVYFYNVKWRNNNTIIPTAGGEYLDRPEIYYESGAAGLTNIFYQGTSFDVTVCNVFGIPIENATVTLINEADESTVFTTTTDANGAITSQDVIYESGQYDGSGVYGNGSGTDYSWLHTDWTTRSFRLEVESSGYVTNVTRQLTFNTPYNAKISMVQDIDKETLIGNEIGKGVYLI